LFYKANSAFSSLQTALQKIYHRLVIRIVDFRELLADDASQIEGQSAVGSLKGCEGKGETRASVRLNQFP
jgi:hypothetical protein